MTYSGRQNGVPVYVANPGGAPANVAVAAARLGADSAFIGKVGNDYYGGFLRDTLTENKVDTSGMLTDASAPTTLAVVSLTDAGERSFSFYRRNCADTLLSPDEVSDELLGNTRFLHFGSVSLTDDPARTATLFAAKRAKELGATFTYDPNYRAALWDSEERAVEMMKSLLPLADILKVSDEEMLLLTGTEDFEEGSRILSDQGPSLVLVTLGAKGVFVRMGSYSGTVPGFSVRVADTNGAGDTFFGAVLCQISKREGLLDGLGEDELRKIVTYANKAASLTCSRRGAMPAMPYADEIDL